MRGDETRRDETRGRYIEKHFAFTVSASLTAEGCFTLSSSIKTSEAHTSGPLTIIDGPRHLGYCAVKLSCVETTALKSIYAHRVDRHACFLRPRERRILFCLGKYRSCMFGLGQFSVKVNVALLGLR